MKFRLVKIDVKNNRLSGLAEITETEKNMISILKDEISNPAGWPVDVQYKMMQIIEENRPDWPDHLSFPSNHNGIVLKYTSDTESRNYIHFYVDLDGTA